MKKCNICGGTRMNAHEFAAQLREGVEEFIYETDKIIRKGRRKNVTRHTEDWWNEVLSWMLITGRLDAMAILEHSEYITRATANALRAHRTVIAKGSDEIN